jgi:hypothetical protein
MKRILSRFKGSRIFVYAKVDKFGYRLNPKANCRVPTVCMQSVTSAENVFLATHVWLDYDNELEKLCLKQGDIIRFSGVVKPYVRSAKGFTSLEDVLDPRKRIDYNLFEIKDAIKVSEDADGSGSGRHRHDSSGIVHTSPSSSSDLTMAK